MKQPAVYILATGKRGTLYIGVTSDLVTRTWQHREHVVDGFTKRYNVTRLVWYELHGTMDTAITREKHLKKWNREWKLQLISESNPEWRGFVGRHCRIGCEVAFRAGDRGKKQERFPHSRE